MPRTVLITGASSGIGQATAERFLAAGWNVAAGMRSVAKSPLDAAAPGLAVLAMDVTDAASIDAAVTAAEQRFGGIDVLVNNAGYALLGPLEALTPDELRRQFDTNVLGLVAVTQRVLPGMRARRHGAIVNIASIGGRMAFPFTAAYHATKFAVEGLSESIRFELEPHNVRVKVVEPGPIRTNFLGGSASWAGHAAYAARLAGFRRMSEQLNATLPGPDRVATVVFRAATDPSSRLRYTAAPGAIAVLHRFLPDAVWRRLIAFELARRSK
jgi:NAD(P)-dependent dehydrogenase (short-subunit alcohol dehydrogenase family)